MLLQLDFLSIITPVIRVREFARALKSISTQKYSKHHDRNFAYSAISVTIAAALHLVLSRTTQRFDDALVAFQKPLTDHSASAVSPLYQPRVEIQMQPISRWCRRTRTSIGSTFPGRP